jgi:hypothetical protein
MGCTDQQSIVESEKQPIREQPKKYKKENKLQINYKNNETIQTVEYAMRLGGFRHRSGNVSPYDGAHRLILGLR